MTDRAIQTELSRAEVEHVAVLARLALSEEEAQRLQRDLTSILRQVALLNEIDTSGIAPSASILPLRSVMQDDEPRESLPVELALANAPASQESQFRVPPILEGA